MAPKFVNKLQGKRVIVLGGTSGIGFAVAEASIEYGMNVVIASSKQEKVNRAVARIAEAYPDGKDRIRGHVCDLASEDVENNIRKLFDFATDNKSVQLDHVVNTAGDVFGMVKLADATAENISRMGKVRFVGALVCAKVASEYLKPSFESSFTTTGGANSYKPGKGWSVMSGWGAAKDGQVRGLAVDMAPIRVNLVSPGIVKTELLDGIAQGDAERLDGMLKMYADMTLLKRYGTPEDIAETYIYLMKGYFTTGTTEHVEGGYFLN